MAGRPGRPTLRRVAAGVALATVVSVVAAGAIACGAGGAAPKRSPGPSGGPVAPGSLSAISCISPSGCMAVGGAFQGLAGDSATHDIADWWNGTAWRPMKPPGPPTAPFNGVSCTKAPGRSPGPDCMAVGATALTASGRAVAEQWNGRRWRLLRPESPGSQDILTSVSCAGARFCMAVGIYDAGGGFRFLAQVWGGARWRQLAIPTPVGNDLGQLNDVTCTRPTWCMALGGFDNGRGSQSAVTEIWNGTSWLARPSPGPRGATSLQDAVCTNASRCLAVGETDGGNQPLAARWDGASWKVIGPPSSLSGDSQQSMACASASTCMIVGSDGSASTALELSDGRSWRLSPTPNAETSSSWLSGVSCGGPHDCMAVGAKQDGNDAPDYALAERWNGRGWQIVAAP